MLDYSYERASQSCCSRSAAGVADVTTSTRAHRVQLAPCGIGSLDSGPGAAALAAGREDLAREALTRRAAVALADRRPGGAAGVAAGRAGQAHRRLGRTNCRRRWRGSAPARRTHQGRLYRRRGRVPRRRGRHRDLRGDGRRRHGDPARAGQDRADAGPGRRADELLASGALEDATLPGGRDDLQSQLDALTAGHDVDDELARMKAQLPASAPPAAIEGPGTTSADLPSPPGRPPAS